MNQKNYKYLYQKYKTKYFNLINKFNQKGGNDINNIDEIIKTYKLIPQSGLYDESLSNEERNRLFKIFCNYLINKTRNYEDIIELKRRMLLQRKKLTDTNEYKLLLKNMKNRGRESQKIGEDFEKKTFSKLQKIISEKLKVKDFEIIKNPVLYLKNERLTEEKGKDYWETIGEIDSIIISKSCNVNYIIGICEIKYNFDDIPDALFQIKRSFEIFKNKGKDNVKLNNIILDDNFKLKESSTFLNTGFIFTSFSDIDYFNIQSKIRHYLINNLHLSSKVKYKKLLKKINKKREYLNKLTGKKIKRYDNDVLSTIKLYQDNILLDHIQIIQ